MAQANQSNYHTASKVSGQPCSKSNFGQESYREQDNQCDQENKIGRESGRLNSVVSELGRLSQSFVHSYQTLESQVEDLNGRLQTESLKKQSALDQNQILLEQKAALTDRMQNLLSVMPAGVVVIDALGRVSECNAFAVSILGEPLLGQKWVEIIHRAFEPQADDGHQVSLRDGRKIHIETCALDGEPGQIIVLSDLTKTRALQAELSQQQKLSSMGKMIASLAHQIRTPLSAAILYASHLSSETVSQAVKQQFTNNLMERLQYIERQVNDMLRFMRGERSEKSLLKVVELYSRLQAECESLCFPIEFQINDDQKSILSLQCDQDALIGALVNLAENACHACELVEDPKITIDFYLDSLLTIKIKDNGCGIADADMTKILEPFFSTKQKGTGLGLAIARGIIIDHGGAISVNSKKDEFTEFTIRLPIETNSKQSNKSLENVRTTEEVTHGI